MTGQLQQPRVTDVLSAVTVTLGKESRPCKHGVKTAELGTGVT